MLRSETNVVILFDDICVLCSSCLQFVIHRDRVGRFAFASLQSAIGQRLKAHYGLDLETIETMVLIERGRALTQSDAVLRVAWHLGGAWRVVAMLRVFPRAIRDGVYRLVAKNRYRWFGKRDVCWVPSSAFASRLLTDDSF